MVKKCFKKNANVFRGESNPFNIKVNRQKHSILNSKTKGTKGLPYISKGVSHAKRKELWQKSKIASQKSNRYFDKRKSDPSMSVEDQVTARFVRERLNKGKKNIFNLNDDEEELTHQGQPLSKMKSFNNDKNNDEEDEGNLDASFVSKAHFGGFASESNFESPKTHKELLEQLIVESKQKKMERKMEREKYFNTQEQVDKAWKDIHFKNSSIVSDFIPIKATKQSLFGTKDAYDVSKNELKFEPKCSSITHKKSAEEVAKEDEAKKIKLEQERLARMVDDLESKSSKNDDHLSADGIFDYFDYLQPVVVEDIQEQNTAPQSDDEVSDSDESLNSIDSFENDDLNDKEKNPNLSFDQDIFESNISQNSKDIPQNIESFRMLVKDSNPDQVHETINNILKPIVRSKSDKILNKLQSFFGVLLQYGLECCEKNLSCKEHLSVLVPHLHSLASAVPTGTARLFLDILDQEQQIFQECKMQNLKQDFPRLQTLLILKYSGMIYCVSDFRHPVVTPSVVFMCDILSSKFSNSYTNILSRLIINDILLDCIRDSKRFIPETLIFLNHILALAIPGKKEKFNLCLKGKTSSEDIPQLDIFHFKKSSTKEEKVIGIIAATINQLHNFALIYNTLLSFREIFSPTIAICNQLPLEDYPVILQKQIEDFKIILQSNVSMRHLVYQNAKPKPLKMFEPSFESKFDQKDDIKKKRKLIKNVSQKIRKEEKSMLREIRRDAQVIASEKQKEKMEADAERKRKVKEIYGELAMQEGEFKKMMKKKT